MAVTVTFVATPRSRSSLAIFTDNENNGLSVTATPIDVSISRGGNVKFPNPVLITSVTLASRTISLPFTVAFASTRRS